MRFHSSLSLRSQSPFVPARAFWTAIALAVALWVTPAPGQECADCHDSGPASHTAHEDVDCASCHLDHSEFPHPDDAMTASCDMCHSDEADRTALGAHGRARAAGNDMAPDCSLCHGAAHDVELPGTTRFRRATVVTCGMCHTEEAEEFQQSVHGDLLMNGTAREGPICTTCHGEHDVEQPSNRAGAKRGVRETCASCHANVELMARFGLPTDRVVSFDASFHGLALQAGSQTVANCGSCHGVHEILPSSDPRSTINVNNLDETCGKCHPGAGERFEIGTVHQVEGNRPVLAAQVIEQIYLVLIPLTIGLMLLHHFGDFVRKMRGHVRAHADLVMAGAESPPREMRMFRLERVQHGLLILSFGTLAWTGFALRNPDAFWAYPLVVWEGAWPVRGYVHRIAGAVMIATALYHVVTLVWIRKLRAHWKHLIPSAKDVREGLAGFAYNVGLRKGEPDISAHSYIEKVEYWAVVWGTLLMGVTGLLLWADDFILSRFTKGVLDVAGVFHYYEAVLAALAILVWHFYSVIFDPKVYPMNMAWLTGYGPSRNAAKPNPEDEQPAADADKASNPDSEKEPS